VKVNSFMKAGWANPLTLVKSAIAKLEADPQYFQKAGQDSVSGALFHPQDLSNIIYLNGVPDHPFMMRCKVDDTLKSDPHIWSEMAFNSASGTSAYFYEGNAPSVVSTVPSQLQNNIFQVGLSAQVTDKQAAMFAKPGGWRLQAGSGMEWFKSEMELQMKGRIIEVLDEKSYILINGVGTTTVAASLTRTDVQCDGMLEQITNNTVAAGSVLIQDDHIISLAKAIRDRKTGRTPQVLYVNSNQKKTMDTWATNIWFGRNRNLEAGRDVSTFNSGFGVFDVVIEDHMPVGSISLIDHAMWWKMDLIPLMAEPLARDSTKVKKMVTYYGTLKCGNDRSSGKITGLSE